MSRDEHNTPFGPMPALRKTLPGKPLYELETKGLASSNLAPGTAIHGGCARRYCVLTGAGAFNEAKSVTDRLRHGLTWPLKVRA
jgi:hypothetical protein